MSTQQFFSFKQLPGKHGNALASILKAFYFCGVFRDVAQPGSALRSGRRGRWFESSHPD